MTAPKLRGSCSLQVCSESPNLAARSPSHKLASAEVSWPLNVSEPRKWAAKAAH